MYLFISKASIKLVVGRQCRLYSHAVTVLGSIVPGPWQSPFSPPPQPAVLRRRDGNAAMTTPAVRKAI